MSNTEVLAVRMQPRRRLRVPSPFGAGPRVKGAPEKPDRLGRWTMTGCR
jgi:hypothetical protein